MKGGAFRVVAKVSKNHIEVYQDSTVYIPSNTIIRIEIDKKLFTEYAKSLFGSKYVEELHVNLNIHSCSIEHDSAKCLDQMNLYKIVTIEENSCQVYIVHPYEHSRMKLYLEGIIP